MYRPPSSQTKCPFFDFFEGRGWAGFSLNFSSAGKGQFMDGKATNIDKTFLGSGEGEGGRGGGGGRWSEVHGPRRHWEIFFIPIF